MIGLFGILIFNDPRTRFAQGKVEPIELPPEAVVAPAWRQALAALLGGVCAGLGVATLLSLARIDQTLYVDPRSRVFYRR